MVIEPREAAVLDANSAFLGVPTGTLMKNAGEAVARVIAKRFSPRHPAILCGAGNNGGDGMVAAAKLRRDGVPASVVLVGSAASLRTEETRRAHADLLGLGVPVHEWGTKAAQDALSKSDLLVDALLGTGLRGDPRGALREAIETINASRKPTVSVDVPSGLGSNYAVRPALTVTLHDAKAGMDARNSAEIVVEPIGIPPKAATHLGPGDLSVFYPRPEAASHKGHNGRLLIVGGGPYAGAPALAGMAALRCGADLVHIATPTSVAATVQAWSPAYIVHPLEGAKLSDAHVARVAPLLEKVDAMLIGPGLGDDARTLAAARTLCTAARKADVALVIDADAFKALAGAAGSGASPAPGGALGHLVGDTSSIDGHRAVVTPHAREFQTLTGLELPREPEARARIVQGWARDHRVTVLLKGPVDVVTNGASVKFNDVHHVAMTHGGTGDVLAGLVACLLSKGVEPFHAARAACFLNGYAGLRAAAETSYGMTATDLVDEIPAVLRDVLG